MRAGQTRLATRLVPDAQFMRFLIAGIANTAFGYLAFLAALLVCPTTLSAIVASTLLAVCFNFFSQGLYVFRSVELRRIWRFCLTYLLILAYNAAGISALERWGVPPQLGGLLLLPGAVLMSYGLNSRFVFVRGAATPART